MPLKLIKSEKGTDFLEDCSLTSTIEIYKKYIIVYTNLLDMQSFVESFTFRQTS